MLIINRSSFFCAYVTGKVEPPDHSATFIVKGSFRLVPDGMAEPLEESEVPLGDLFYENDSDRSCVYESDFAMFKPRADLLLSGKCHPPEDRLVEGCQVTFQVGEQRKRLYVFGDRWWRRDAVGGWTISDPEPFREMALVYENSFGGPDYKDNPHGKGIGRKLTENGLELRPLPNVEDPGHLITHPDDRPAPAGFGPLGRMWPLRMAGRIGTYDERWLQERWPWLPADFDWTYFNCAPPDMQVNGYLRGDESLFFENLHPRFSRYRCRLPGLRARCFLDEQTRDGSRFREVKLHLDTLFVEMEVEKLHLIWRGNVAVAGEDLEEIQHCLVVSEFLTEEAKSLSDYQALFKQWLQEEEQEEADEGPDFPTIDDSWIQEMVADIATLEQEFQEVEAQAAEIEKSTMAILKEAGIDPAEIEKSGQAAERMSIRDILTLARKQEEEIREADPELAAKLPPPMTDKEIGEIQEIFQFDAVFEEDTFPEPLTREKCRARLVDRGSFENEDLSGLDLSDLDFSDCNCRGANFEGTVLHGAMFVGSDLSGANLAGCDLSGLNLRGGRLSEADLTGADLSSADLRDTVLDDADFSGAVLAGCHLEKTHGFRTIFVGAFLEGAKFTSAMLTEADFEGATLEGVDFEQAVLREASVEGARGRGVNMRGADLTGLQGGGGPNFIDGFFQGARASGSIWEEALLDRADFSGAELVEADFTRASLKEARFTGADLTRARFDKADLSKTIMTFVNLFQGSLEKARLLEADFRGANMYEVEFYLAENRQSRFEGANLKMTKLAGDS